MIALKVLILGLTGAMLAYRIGTSQGTLWEQLWSSITSAKGIFVPAILVLAALNWLLEIVKWQILANQIRPVSLREAARQCLAAFSASAITPNRLGEYAFKGLFFSAKQRKRVLLLKLHANLSQLLVTLLLGVPGVIVVASMYRLGVSHQKLLHLALAAIAIGMLAYLARNKTLYLKGLSLKRVWSFYSRLSLYTHLSVTALALLRYLVFGTLFLILLHFFGGSLPLQVAVPLLTAMYLLSSALPSFVLFDFVVKGGVGVWLFSMAGVPHWVVIHSVFTMWLLSFALPATLGTYYVARFKPHYS